MAQRTFRRSSEGASAGELFTYGYTIQATLKNVTFVDKQIRTLILEPQQFQYIMLNSNDIY